MKFTVEKTKLIEKLQARRNEEIVNIKKKNDEDVKDFANRIKAKKADLQAAIKELVDMKLSLDRDDFHIAPNQELAKKWLAELRSGKHRQTKYALKSQDGMCCMGVLLNTIDPAAWSEDAKSNVCSHPLQKLTSFGQVMQYPDDGVMDSVGVKWSRSLSNANDVKNATFQEIADALEPLIIEPSLFQRVKKVLGFHK